MRQVAKKHHRGAIYYGIVNLRDDDVGRSATELGKKEVDYFGRLANEVANSDNKQVDSIQAQAPPPPATRVPAAPASRALLQSADRSEIAPNRPRTSLALSPTAHAQSESEHSLSEHASSEHALSAHVLSDHALSDHASLGAEPSTRHAHWRETLA